MSHGKYTLSLEPTNPVPLVRNQKILAVFVARGEISCIFVVVEINFRPEFSIEECSGWKQLPTNLKEPI
jgi:hypothetical protein